MLYLSNVPLSCQMFLSCTACLLFIQEMQQINVLALNFDACSIDSVLHGTMSNIYASNLSACTGFVSSPVNQDY